MSSEVPDNLDLWKQLVINQQEVISLQRNQLEHREMVAKELGEIKDLLAQTKGGWKALMWLGGAAATAATAGAWIWTNIIPHAK